MSFSGEQTRLFFAPLWGRTTTFLIQDRQANLDFARTVLSLIAQGGDSFAVFDLDAFYSSNSDTIFKTLGRAAPEDTAVRVPEPGANIESEFSTLFETRQKIIVIDSLNSFFHLISQEDGSSRSRKLTFAVASLSYFAKTNGKAVVLIAYRREGYARGGTGRWISSLSDLTATVGIRGETILVSTESSQAWPGGKLSIRIPSG
jgi:hypothetical protein